ncbi:MAG: hypothetical protein SGBAC_008911 [Bacillariaceae sp.]
MLSSVATAALRRTTATRQFVRPVTARWFSDSHDDFAPKRKVVEGADAALQMIQEHVDSNPVMLYMKGNPSMPMCGFSAQVVQALKAEGIDFGSVNVLDYPDIREGVKKFAEWPTIPQLYVNGEFIGGCDIVIQMHENGELADLLKEVETTEE